MTKDKNEGYVQYQGVRKSSRAISNYVGGRRNKPERETMYFKQLEVVGDG